jgi:S-adenosylmethionine:tRNA ribosyltransferase-isomerase
MLNRLGKVFRGRQLAPRYFSDFVPKPPVMLPSLHELDYELPNERIALNPHVPRHHSRLLVYKPQPHTPTPECLRHLRFDALPGELPPNSTLILNESAVIAARLPVRRRGGQGKAAEVMCLEPILPR